MRENKEIEVLVFYIIKHRQTIHCRSPVLRIRVCILIVLVQNKLDFFKDVMVHEKSFFKEPKVQSDELCTKCIHEAQRYLHKNVVITLDLRLRY